jgi:tetratricopeptide (TPR) repeat protein
MLFSFWLFCHQHCAVILVYTRLGKYKHAIELYEQALAIAREVGNRQGEGDALWNLSLTLDKLGDRDQAIAQAEAALTIRGQIEDPKVNEVQKQLAEWRGQQ